LTDSAVAGLVGHLDLDVFAAHPYLQPVEHVGNGFHGFRHQAIAEVFLG